MTIRDVVRAHHDLRTHGCRAGRATENGTISPFESGCFNGVTSTMKNQASGGIYPYVIFNGDGPDYPFEILHDRHAKNAILRERRVSWNEFVGTQRSLKWVEYLLCGASPWWKLSQYFHTRDAEYINQAGFIFEANSGGQLPTKLLYNFCMAMRFCWDQPSEFAAWLALCKHGLPYSDALFIAMNFTPKSDRIEGLWEIMWPWNFLEDGGIECVYRFTQGLPATLEAGSAIPHNPNIQPLWAVGKPDAKWIKKMTEAPRLLVEIIEDVRTHKALQKQRLTGVSECAA
jgi:hypothetical protein